MANWKNNDREQSKPNWLTEEQKRQCIRTVRGWEIPSSGTPITSTGDDEGDYEVIVALSISDTDRTSTSAVNDAPYFVTPLTGDSPTQGGPSGNGLTALSLVFGTTGYIPLIVADADQLDPFSSLVITGPFVDGTLGGLGGNTGTWKILTPATATADFGGGKGGGLGEATSLTGTLTPALVTAYLGGITDGGAIIQVTGGITGVYSVMCRVFDDQGATGEVTFKVGIGPPGYT